MGMRQLFQEAKSFGSIRLISLILSSAESADIIVVKPFKRQIATCKLSRLSIFGYVDTKSKHLSIVSKSIGKIRDTISNVCLAIKIPRLKSVNFWE